MNDFIEAIHTIREHCAQRDCEKCKHGKVFGEMSFDPETAICPFDVFNSENMDNFLTHIEKEQGVN